MDGLLHLLRELLAVEGRFLDLDLGLGRVGEAVWEAEARAQRPALEPARLFQPMLKWM